MSEGLSLGGVSLTPNKYHTFGMKQYQLSNKRRRSAVKSGNAKLEAQAMGEMSCWEAYVVAHGAMSISCCAEPPSKDAAYFERVNLNRYLVDWLTDLGQFPAPRPRGDNQPDMPKEGS